MRLKSRAELEQEQIEARLRITGNYQLPTDRDAVPYVRQSTTKQIRENKFAGETATEFLIDKAVVLGWQKHQIRPASVENEIMGKRGKVLRGVSGTRPIEKRLALKELMELIKGGTIGALLVEDISRLTRGEDLVDATALAAVCKQAECVIVTAESIFDFRRTRDFDAYIQEAKNAADYIRYQTGSKEHREGKMYKGRLKKQSMGMRPNEIAPVGLHRDEQGSYTATVHAPIVDRLYTRFHELAGSVSALQNEILQQARAGIPLFPVHPSINPASMYLKEVYKDGELVGWTIGSRVGLIYILSNAMYIGCITDGGKVIKRDAFNPIVNRDNWQWAFEQLSDRDLDGNPMQRAKRAVRYWQHAGYQPQSSALLQGVRHDGRPVVDGLNGCHVYMQKDPNRCDMYGLKNVAALTNEGAISVSKLDRIIEARLLDHLSMRVPPIRTFHEELDIMDTPQYRDRMEELNRLAKGKQEPIETDLLASVTAELAGVERRLKVAGDIMDDKELRETYVKQASLIRRKAELEEAQDKADKIAQQKKQAKKDVETASTKWAKWSLDERRQFIHMTTHAILLEKVDGGVRVTIQWNELMGNVTDRAVVIRWSKELPEWVETGNEVYRSGISASDTSFYEDLHRLVAA